MGNNKFNSHRIHREAVLCYQKLTPGVCQLNAMVHKGGKGQVHDACAICTAVGKKVCPRMKRHRTVLIKPVALSYAWLKEAFSQLVENLVEIP